MLNFFDIIKIENYHDTAPSWRRACKVDLFILPIHTTYDGSIQIVGYMIVPFEEISTVDEAYLEKLVESMPQYCEDVTAADGSHVRWWMFRGAHEYGTTVMFCHMDCGDFSQNRSNWPSQVLMQ